MPVLNKRFEMGAVAVGAISILVLQKAPPNRDLDGIERAHELGMVTVLWAYLRNPFKDGVDYASADSFTRQSHLASTIGADVRK